MAVVAAEVVVQADVLVNVLVAVTWGAQDVMVVQVVLIALEVAIHLVPDVVETVLVHVE